MSDRRYPSPSHNFVPEYQQSGIPHAQTKSFLSANAVSNITDYSTPDFDDQAAVDAQLTKLNTFKFTFETVTRWVCFHCHYKNGHTGNFRVYFSSDSALRKNDRYFLVDTESTTVRLELKCKELWVVPEDDENSVVSLIAGITNINSLDFPDQTSSNGFTGV